MILTSGQLPVRYRIQPKATRRTANVLSSTLLRAVGICVLVCVVCALAQSQTRGDNPTTSSGADSLAIENPGVPVEIDGRPVLVVYAQVGGFTPQERAEAIQQRIIAVSKTRDIQLEAIHAEDRGTWSEILAGPNRIMGVTEGDAQAAERKRLELAAEYAEIIRQVVERYRADHTWNHVLLGFFYTAIATVGLTGFLIILLWVRRRARSSVEKWLGRVEAETPGQTLKSRLWRYFGRPIVALGRAGSWILVLALVQAYVTLVLRFFPSTRYTSYQITNWLFSGLAGFGKVVIRYIPDFILLVFILLVTSYLIKLNEYIFGEIRDQKVAIRGFYSDWAEPTANLVRVLIIAAAAVIAFPYLPGSNSPAFKGISVFLGVLLSLGSTSAMAHGVAGTILTYMRAFQVGNFVRIGNDVGEVVEKTLLVTRIRTQKNEIVTIPNGTVLGGVVVNYSGEEKNKGVIFHATVTIGYNAAWRQVHELLISAALATDDVLRDPPPFVLQTALYDFYVAYELNAYTAKPSNMQMIYSMLHQNIQDKFNEAGVEINSPHYTSLRDGNQTTIPAKYLPDNYKSPVFEIKEINGSQAERERVA
jgi:small-conductance mechanosensitive channel